MYILRSIKNDSKGKFMVDTWYMFEELTEMVAKVRVLSPDAYQCFSSEEISNEIFSHIEGLEEREEVAKRRLAYEVLKSEFEPQEE